MARIQGDLDAFHVAPFKHFGWKHFRDLSRENDTADEYNCDCVSSEPENIPGKITKNHSRKSHASTVRRHNADKKIRKTRSRRKIRQDTKKSTQSPQNGDYLTLCDEPRRVKKIYKTTDTTHYSPNEMQVKSVEVMRSWSIEQCRTKYSDEKISKREKKLRKKIRRKPKVVTTKRSNTSVSSSSTDVRYIKPRTRLNARDGIDKSDDKNPLNVATQKSREKNCPCCDSLMEAVKPSRVPTYPKSNRRREVSRERIYKRRESPRPLEKEFAKKLETTQKVRGESQMESWSRGSKCKTQKLCRVLKTREARQFMGCHCIESDDKVNPFVNCQCPECPLDLNIINDALNTPEDIHQGNMKKIIFDNSEICPSELNSSNVCTCAQPQFENECYISKSNEENYTKINPTTLSHKFVQRNNENFENSCKKYQDAAEQLREIYRETKKSEQTGRIINKCMTQSRIDNLQAQCSNNPMLPVKKKDASTIAASRKPTMNRIIQCDAQFVSSHAGLNKVSDDQDPVQAVASLCEKLKMINREIKPQCSCKSPHITSHINADSGEKDTSNHDLQYAQKEKSKFRMKHHHFAFPKIVKGDNVNKNSDVPKMFVYSADEDGSPLSLYKTGSFVKCAIKRNNDVGNKYYVAYIQKYMSPAWKSDDNLETELKSSEYLSSDDYG